jgi:hypothetical protein
MKTLIIAIVIMFLVLGFSAGLGYFIWLKTRPKKVNYLAKIYQLGKGVSITKNKKTGELEDNLLLRDLIPYGEDVLQKQESNAGMHIWKLLKLDKVVNEPNACDVEYWGKEKKEVSILYDHGDCYILSKGYDDNTGQKIVKPLSIDRVNTIKSEIIEKKDRIKKNKDILEAISPWITAIVITLGLIGITYILMSGLLEINERNAMLNEEILKIQDKQLQVIGQLEKIQGNELIITNLTQNLNNQKKIQTIDGS